MINQRNKKETKEEYDARKALEEEKRKEAEKEKAKFFKETSKALMKANTCPECKKSQLRRFRRKNYTFGRKSKAIITKGKRCPKCGYTRIDTK